MSAVTSQSHHHGKRVVLVGGSGFVGRHLAMALIQQQSGCKVLILDIAPCPEELQSFMNVSHIQLDMTQESELTRVLGNFKPDIVVDIAGWGMSGMDMLNPRCLTVNVLGTQRLINACIYNNIDRLIYTSTYNVVFCGKEIDHGDETQPYVSDEDHLDQYSRSKTRAEQLARQANGTCLSNGKRLITSVIRPAAIYGENEQRHLPRILMHLDMGMFMFRIGTAKVDWVHVDNLVLSYVLLVDKLLTINDHTEKPAGCAYFISDGSPIDNFEFLKPLCLARGRQFPEMIIPVQVLFVLSSLFESIFYIGKMFGLIFPPPLTRAEIAKVGITHNFSLQNATRDFGYTPKFDSSVGSERLGQFYKDFPQSNFFQFAHWIWYIMVLTGLILLAMVAFLSDSILYENPFLHIVLKLGLYLFQSKYGLQMVFYCAILTHCLEALLAAIIASQLCPNTMVMWFIQTLILGYPSLGLLLNRSHSFL